MKNNALTQIARVLFVALAAVAVCTSCTSCKDDPTPKMIDAANNTISSSQTEIEKINGKIIDAETRISNATNDVEAAKEIREKLNHRGILGTAGDMFDSDEINNLIKKADDKIRRALALQNQLEADKKKLLLALAKEERKENDAKKDLEKLKEEK
jgi:hypothetical protein